MRATFHLAAFLSLGVPVFEIRDAGGMTDLLVRNDELGRALATTLGDHSVALMRGHGDVVVGPTIPMAVFRAVYTEVNARIQAQAIALGGPVTYLDPEEGRQAGKAIDQIHLRAWGSVEAEGVRAAPLTGGRIRLDRRAASGSRAPWPLDRALPSCDGPPR